jgi:hypothetical protein
MSAATELERVFLPLLREEERAVSARYPLFRFSTGASSVGGSTPYQGHQVWLDCVFPDATLKEEDLLSVVVRATQLTTEPKLSEATVAWGNGRYPPGKAELISQPVALTREAMNEVAARMPELFAVFRSALQEWHARSRDA